MAFQSSICLSKSPRAPVLGVGISTLSVLSPDLSVPCLGTVLAGAALSAGALAGSVLTGSWAVARAQPQSRASPQIVREKRRIIETLPCRQRMLGGRTRLT